MVALIEEFGGSADECSTLDDVVARYARLDEVFEQVRHEGGLRTRKELGGRLREHGGVYVHIGRNGSLLFGNGGIHRLVMAQVLDLDVIPAQIGVVHAERVSAGRPWH